MSTKFIFDLDNTLVFTDVLNNEAYNYALSYVGLPKVIGYTRIERKVLDYLTQEEQERIIAIKQNYFLQNIAKTVPNKSLIELLSNSLKENCMLWTSADIKRAEAILDYYKLQNAFDGKLYTKKKEITKDIEHICERLLCLKEDLLVYEDNLDNINRLRDVGIRVEAVILVSNYT